MTLVKVGAAVTCAVSTASAASVIIFSGFAFISALAVASHSLMTPMEASLAQVVVLVVMGGRPPLVAGHHDSTTTLTA
jgi:hypothetical protein